MSEYEYRQQHVSRIVIGAPQGRSGKTTFTLGLLKALAQAGRVPQPFKKGPDYIDPSWHTAAAGRRSRNLDSFFMSAEDIRLSVVNASQGAGIAVIEGAMGFYDGMDLQGSCSTAEIAKVTQSPVILVLDATRMTRSAAAMVMGFQHFDPEVNIAGVVLNKVARARHEKSAREAIEKFCGIPVIGAIPKDTKLAIPDRHLGLVTEGEMEASLAIIEQLAETVRQHVDLELLCRLAQTAPPLAFRPSISADNVKKITNSYNSYAPRLGVLQDQAFSFYYPENLEALQKLGIELVTINSLHHSNLPEIDGLYIGGGFPEVFAAELAANSGLRQAIKAAGEADMPIYAECGGLMYLGRSIIQDGKSYPMVGLLPFDTVVENKPQGHGYTILEPLKENWWLPREVHGHEFHNSRIINLGEGVQFAFQVKRGVGIDGRYDGILYRNTLAAYTHIHTLGCPAWAARFADLVYTYAHTRRLNCKQAAGV